MSNTTAEQIVAYWETRIDESGMSVDWADALESFDGGQPLAKGIGAIRVDVRVAGPIAENAQDVGFRARRRKSAALDGAGAAISDGPLPRYPPFQWSAALGSSSGAHQAQLVCVPLKYPPCRSGRRSSATDVSAIRRQNTYRAGHVGAIGAHR
jgi:hypothetical protein